MLTYEQIERAMAVALVSRAKDSHLIRFLVLQKKKEVSYQKILILLKFRYLTLLF